MIQTHIETGTGAEQEIVRIWTRASEQVFEKLTSGNPPLRWARQLPTEALNEQLGSLEWWEAEYDAGGRHCVWVGIAAPVAVEIGRLAQALASGGEQEPAAGVPAAQEAVESICETFGRLLAGEAGGKVAYRGLRRLEAAPTPEVIYSSQVALPPATSAPVVVGFRAETGAVFQPLLSRTESSPQGMRPDSTVRGAFDLFLDLELPLSVRFGRAQMPLERVLQLQPGSLVELESSPDDRVELLVNGSVVARGEVVAVEGHYGVRIREVLSRDGQAGGQRPASAGPGV
jgi:flagellar motor switch protein FliN/FliY